jgi:ATP-dependent RNA helicase RhlB
MVKSLINTIRNKFKGLTQTAKSETRSEESRPQEPGAKTPSAERADTGRDTSLQAESRKKGRKSASDSKTEGRASTGPEKRKRSRRRRKPENTGSPSQPAPAPDRVQAHESWDISMFDVDPEEGKQRFHDFDLPSEVMHAVADLNYRYPTPIQTEILPPTLAGRDASGQAQTGTGKTAAFLISILTHMIRNPIQGERPPGTPRVLILAPTRELVVQISDEAKMLSKYFPCHIANVFGGMDYQKQRRQLTDRVVDIVVATPGRLIDFSEHGDVNLGKIEILVIDEADRLVDMGFMPQIRRIVRQTPHKDRRQTLMFSATMIGDVERAASQWMTDPVEVEIEPEQIEVDTVEQVIYLVTAGEKKALLYNIIQRQNLERVIIFCNRRDETQRIGDLLSKYGIKCSVISGDVPQKKRLRIFENIRSGNIRVMVATDVAGRGLHIEGVSHVINYTLPQDPENYVHRIGRTGRAGATGVSISFADETDSFYIPAIEEFLGHKISCIHPEEDWLKLPPPPKEASSGDRPTKPRKRKPRKRPRPGPGKKKEAGSDR